MQSHLTSVGRLKSQQQVRANDDSPQHACLRRLNSSRRRAASGSCCSGFNRPCPTLHTPWDEQQGAGCISLWGQTGRLANKFAATTLPSCPTATGFEPTQVRFHAFAANLGKTCPQTEMHPAENRWDPSAVCQTLVETLRAKLSDSRNYSAHPCGLS